jgi:hypothetical protein
MLPAHEQQIRPWQQPPAAAHGADLAALGTLLLRT